MQTFEPPDEALLARLKADTLPPPSSEDDMEEEEMYNEEELEGFVDQDPIEDGPWTDEDDFDQFDAGSEEE